MPTYEYQCEKCGFHFERFQKMSEERIKRCPECGGKVHRLIGTGGGIIFKGHGFYATDYHSGSKGSGCWVKPAAPSVQSHFGMSRGGGMGMGVGMGRGMGQGRGMGRGRGTSAWPSRNQSEPGSLRKEEELRVLKEEANELRKQIEVIESGIKNLEKE